MTIAELFQVREHSVALVCHWKRYMDQLQQMRTGYEHLDGLVRERVWAEPRCKALLPSLASAATR